MLVDAAYQGLVSVGAFLLLFLVYYVVRLAWKGLIGGTEYLDEKLKESAEGGSPSLLSSSRDRESKQSREEGDNDPIMPSIPKDSVDSKGVFRYMGKSETTLYQSYLDELLDSLHIDEKAVGEQWTDEESGTMVEIFNRAKDEGLQFIYLHVMMELYDRADKMTRQLHRNSWALTVTGQEKPLELSMFGGNFFPSPAAVFDDVMKTY